MQPLVVTLLARADARPDRPAFLTEAEPISYGRFAQMIRTAAGRLLARGLGHGDRVVLCGRNSPDLAAAYFAVHAAGCVAVLVGADVPASSVETRVAESEARLALLGRELALPIRAADLHAFCAAEPDGLTTLRCGLDDPADLLYTTGTTGREKGVVLTHANITQAAANICAFMGTEADDLEMVPIPLSHSFGLGRLRSMALVGHTLALEPGMRNPAKTLRRLLDLRATGLAMVPAGFELILRATQDHLAEAREHLRYVELGSEAMPPETRQRLMDLLPRTRICHHYGLTEASRAAFIEYHAERAKLGSIGRPSPNVEIAVVDEQGRALPPGQPGELAVRGGMVMKEYWKQPELTARVLRGGWFRTGDRGHCDADGYLYLAGRQSLMVNVGGLKVCPEEVEGHLNAHPAVVESACAGVPDPQAITGECLQASVVTRAPVSDQQLIDWLRGRVEEYKIPRLWRRVERIVRTASGKVQR
jgi:long-chain acyl-CoA synthetase